MVWGKELLSWNKIAGIAIGAAGAGLLIGYGKQITVDSNQRLGDILVMINATSYALYLVLVRALLQKYHPFTVVRWICTFGLIYVLPLWLCRI